MTNHFTFKIESEEKYIIYHSQKIIDLFLNEVNEKEITDAESGYDELLETIEDYVPDDLVECYNIITSYGLNNAYDKLIDITEPPYEPYTDITHSLVRAIFHHTVINGAMYKGKNLNNIIFKCTE